MSKYNSKKWQVDGITFDSKTEARRWVQLKALEDAGEIKELRRQVEYMLIPSQKLDIPVKRGKSKRKATTERPVYYKADFVYISGSQEVVEDVKGVRTPEYIIKRKLMKYIHNIEIREV